MSTTGDPSEQKGGPGAPPVRPLLVYGGRRAWLFAAAGWWWCSPAFAEPVGGQWTIARVSWEDLTRWLQVAVSLECPTGRSPAAHRLATRFAPVLCRWVALPPGAAVDGASWTLGLRVQGFAMPGEALASASDLPPSRMLFVGC